MGSSGEDGNGVTKSSLIEVALCGKGEIKFNKN